MNPEPRPSLVSICTTEGARFAATAAMGSVEPALVATVVGFGKVAVDVLPELDVPAVRTIVVVVCSVARATAYPLAARDSAMKAAMTGERRRRGSGGPGVGGWGDDSGGGGVAACDTVGCSYGARPYGSVAYGSEV